MANIFDYIEWRGDLSIKNDPLNDADFLILSRLSYLPFDGIVSENMEDKITIAKSAEAFFTSEKNQKMLSWKGDEKLLEYVSKADRFKNLRLSGYVNKVEDEKQMQFSVVVIELEKDLHFVSFSGTDNTVVGWQEDFNMYYMFPLPSQIMAVKYLEKVASQFKGNFILGGHSKGGNLSVYSAIFCSDETRSRITKVYNHDGPGFDSKVCQEAGYKAIKDRINTYIPQSSIVGMMFEHQEEYTIIKSNQKGFFQHDIYTWEIRQKDLVRLSNTTSTSVFVDNTITDCVGKMSTQERKEFVEGIFTLLKSTENKTFNEIMDHWGKNTATIIKTFKNMDSKTRSHILLTLVSFMKCAKNNFSDINPLRKANRLRKRQLHELP